MKVIVVNDHLVPDGGADVVALASAEALAASGIEVTLLVGDHASDGIRAGRVRVVGTGQHDLMSNPRRMHAALQGLWNVVAARALGALLREHDPRDTVVHLHSWTKSVSSSVVRTARSSGFAVVCTLHDYFSVCPNGALFDFQSGTVCLRTPLSLDCVTAHCDARRYAHKLYRVARHLVQQTFGGLPDAVREFVVVSRFSERLLAPHLPRDAHLHYVRNPIDVERGPCADVQQSDTFVMVARLLRPKGQWVFLEACERAGVPAICVGDGPELDALRARFPRARFTGRLPRAEVGQLMRSARALVMPALWYETQGLVVDEAAALGVPAVVSDGCAGSESVAHEESGLLVRSGDVADLAAALCRLSVDAALAARLGRCAYQRFWSAPPTLAAHAQSLLGVYRSALARAGTQPAASSAA